MYPMPTITAMILFRVLVQTVVESYWQQLIPQPMRLFGMLLMLANITMISTD